MTILKNLIFQSSPPLVNCSGEFNSLTAIQSSKQLFQVECLFSWLLKSLNAFRSDLPWEWVGRCENLKRVVLCYVNSFPESFFFLKIISRILNSFELSKHLPSYVNNSFVLIPWVHLSEKIFFFALYQFIVWQSFKFHRNSFLGSNFSDGGEDRKKCFRLIFHNLRFCSKQFFGNTMLWASHGNITVNKEAWKRFFSMGVKQNICGTREKLFFIFLMRLLTFMILKVSWYSKSICPGLWQGLSEIC